MKLEFIQPKIKTNPNFQHMNKPCQIILREVLQLWLLMQSII